MIELEPALAQILASVPKLPAESLATANALGRFTSEAIGAMVDLPLADNSAMDGYAARAEDIVAATPEAPVRLRLIGIAAAGKPLDARVETGMCVRIFTGSVLPAGADAVVMQEDVRASQDEVLFVEKITPWENIRLRGEDVKVGEVIAGAGERLTASLLGLAAAAGVAEMRVGRRPVAGIIATGSELAEPGAPLGPGMIYESNRTLLAAMASQAGAIPKTYPILADTLSATIAALEHAFAECDFVITSGGVSVGDMDFVKAAFAQMDGKLEFWTVSMRPGKPFAFGRWKEKLLFGLPGNPVSAAVTFLLLTRPALLRAQGARDIGARKAIGILAEPLSNSGGRRNFMRVVVGPDGHIHSAGAQGSHRLGALAKSSGLVDVPPRTTLPEGALVPILFWD